jgi:serine/threonine protein kinase
VAEKGNAKGKQLNPERWQRVRKVFEAALEQEPAARPAFLDGACSGDPELRAEVEGLLANHDSGEEFLEVPVYEAAAGLLENETGDSLVGTRVGPYELTQVVGQGGMGVVYLARDYRLDRLVAIKAVPPSQTRNPQYRERLRREARAAAKLSHPGIATIYALEEWGDNLYMVREYVQGRTLLEELRAGPLPVDQVLDVAGKIVRALAAAHENGVIHRDLKPENVVRTPAGGVKILDFGVARIVDESAAGLSSLRLTKTGMLIGTPAYSSPEQLLGEDVDFRTDLFSFGIMLFELASAVHPFAASGAISAIARILEAEPAKLSSVNPATPPELDRIVRRCLRKRREERYQSTCELQRDLEQLASGHIKPAPFRAENPSPARPAPFPSSSLLWWWQFHQACIGIIYYLLLYPLWKVREWTPGPAGSLLFFPALVAVGIAANLRFHLWFTSACYPAELAGQRARVVRWVRLGDALFVLLLFAGSVAIQGAHNIIATLLLTGAIGCLVAFLLIEPTTARAAFHRQTAADGSQ